MARSGSERRGDWSASEAMLSSTVLLRGPRSAKDEASAAIHGNKLAGSPIVARGDRQPSRDPLADIRTSIPKESIDRAASNSQLSRDCRQADAVLREFYARSPSRRDLLPL